MTTKQGVRRTQPPASQIKRVEDVLPKLLNIIFTKHHEFVENPERGKFFLGLHDRLLHSSYTLGVRNGKDVITYKPKDRDDLGSIHRGMIFFATELRLQPLNDQSIGIISLQSGICDPNDSAELRACKELVIYVHEKNTGGPISDVRKIAAGLKSHWLESAGFNSRLLKGTDCTVFDCVVRALAPFGVVREDLPRLIWRTPAAGVRNIRRKFFLNNPDLTGEINQTEYPARFQMMTFRRLYELRLKIKERMTRANFIAWQIDGYRNVKKFRGLSLQEVGEMCFPFMTHPMFDRVRRAP